MRAETRARFRGWTRLVVLGGMLSLLATLPAPAAPEEPIFVDVKLVIATDVSHSIDLEELKLEREGIADAFLDPDVVKAIQSGPLGRIAVAMLDWSAYRKDLVVLDWTIVDNKESAAALSEKMRKIPPLLGERTSISNAIQSAIDLIQSSAQKISAMRRVIDVSGDGPNNDGISLEQVHAATANNGIIVNGLPIMDPSSDGYFDDLDQYYAACVVAGKGAFLVVVRSFKDFGAAMRRKLVFEISQNEDQIRQVLKELQPNPLLKKIAAGDSEPPAQLQLRLGTTYPGGCDKYGGWRVDKL